MLKVRWAPRIWMPPQNEWRSWFEHSFIGWASLHYWMPLAKGLIRTLCPVDEWALISIFLLKLSSWFHLQKCRLFNWEQMPPSWNLVKSQWKGLNKQQFAIINSYNFTSSCKEERPAIVMVQVIVLSFSGLKDHSVFNDAINFVNNVVFYSASHFYFDFRTASLDS